eukprot:gnl/MRDRNA2_/MRDRNA2_71560_c0_seq1.p1 gnl/MRDRNA2_/MRDRNA2_71560_c0~~gnl/MRDRNA2_/MRDRNA2_71560_c0_seq1.p1  ORF type:complete len:327 (+),score=59.68 gnl/MRDRNA2_/MRDRNA2_71560_c0_seq1:138-1118(+)
MFEEEQPQHPLSTEVAQELLVDFLSEKQNVVVITGAGMSTDSGIPDYRGVNGSYKKGHKPVLHSEFVNSAAARQRYWGRSIVGWAGFSAAQPNSAHHGLAELESKGTVATIITQNVDRLHQAAGSQQVIDLHGRNDLVRCLSCGVKFPRRDFQDLLSERNATWLASVGGAWTEMRPDGDAAMEGIDFSAIEVPPCLSCSAGVVMPDVVFFGGVVPVERVEKCYEAVQHCDALLCAGSSLAVYSAFRFVQAAAKAGKQIAVLNMGPTRAEKTGLPLLKIEAGVSVLSGLRTVLEERNSSRHHSSSVSFGTWTPLAKQRKHIHNATIT